MLTAEGRISAYVLGALPLFLARRHPGRSTPATWTRCSRAGARSVLLGAVRLGRPSAWSSSSAWSRSTSDGDRSSRSLAARRVGAGAGRSVAGMPARRRARPPTTPRRTSAASTSTDEERDEFAAAPRRAVPRPASLRPLGARHPRRLLGGVLPAQLPRPRPHRKLVHAGPRRPVPGRGDHQPARCSAASSGSCSASWHRRLRRRRRRAPGCSSLVLLPVVGVHAPERRGSTARSQERQDAIRRDLPDTLDLLAISVEAGVGFEGALGVVCEQLRLPPRRRVRPYAAGDGARPPPSGGPPEPQAAHRGARAIELRAALTQADALGMPIGRVLKTQADGDAARSAGSGPGRRRRKLPVKILFPLVLFIFPPIFVVRAGAGGLGDRRRLRLADPIHGDRTASHRSARRSSSSGGAPPACRWPWSSPIDPRPATSVQVGAWAGVLVAVTPVPHDPAGPRRFDLDRLLGAVLVEVALVTAAVVGHRRLGVAVRVLADHAGRRSPGFARGFGFALSHRRRRDRWSSARADAPRPSRRRAPQRRCSGSSSSSSSRSVAGYARRILGEARAERQSCALDRLGQLADANALLFSLHQVAQTLPASLDLDEVLDTTMGRLKDLFELDAAALLVLDETDGSWHPCPPGRASGSRPDVQTDDLPRPLPARARAAQPVICEPNLLAAGGPGLAPRLDVGPLRRPPGPRLDHRPPLARARARPHHFTDRDVELLQRLRRAGRPRHRQRPLVRSPAHRRRRRGAHPHRPRPPRPHRPVARLPRLRARPDRQDRASEATTSALPSTSLRERRARRSSARCATPCTTCAPTSARSQGFSTTLELFLERVRDRSGARGHAARPRDGRGCRSSRSASCCASRRRRSSTSSATPTRHARHRSRGAATAARRRLEVADDGDRLPGRPGRAPRLATACSACGSGRRASAPRSSSTHSPGRARGSAATSRRRPAPAPRSPPLAGIVSADVIRFGRAQPTRASPTVLCCPGGNFGPSDVREADPDHAGSESSVFAWRSAQSSA